MECLYILFFFFQAEDGIRDIGVTGVQTCALPIFDVYSTVTQPETAVVRDDTGKVVVDVAKQDITKLVAAGWVPPVPITVKARDGKTDVYGFMFSPRASMLPRSIPS